MPEDLGPAQPREQEPVPLLGEVGDLVDPDELVLPALEVRLRAGVLEVAKRRLPHDRLQHDVTPEWYRSGLSIQSLSRFDLPARLATEAVFKTVAFVRSAIWILGEEPMDAGVPDHVPEEWTRGEDGQG